MRCNPFVPPVPASPRRSKQRLGHPAVVAEYLSGGLASVPQRKYINASYVDEPVLMIDRTAAGAVGAGTDERFYYHRNQQYSVTALTDAAGAVTERYAYTAYGEPTILDGAGTTTRTASFIGNPYLYTAQEYDAETALYHFNARMYEGRKGRFLSHDPIMYPDGYNTYAGWFSVSAADPMGMELAVPDWLKKLQDDYQKILDDLAKLPADIYKKTCNELCDSWVKRQTDSSWVDSLPDCPCTEEEAKAAGIWKKDNSPFPGLHAGCGCYRSAKPNPILGKKIGELLNPGQQCCYHQGSLVTDGAGAGSPDIVSPQGPVSTRQHLFQDVLPYTWCAGAGRVDDYLKHRKPNKGPKDKPCASNIYPRPPRPPSE